MPHSPRPCYKRFTASVTAWWHRRLLTTRSLRGRLRLSLFVASAGIALLLGGGAIAIDETLERIVLQNTLRAEAAKFSTLAARPRPARHASGILQHYFARPDHDDSVDLNLDKDADINPGDLVHGLLCSRHDHCGLPPWLGLRARGPAQPPPTPPLQLSATPVPRPAENFARQLTRSLTGFYQGAARLHSEVPAAFRRLGVGFHENVAHNGRSYYVLVQPHAGGLIYIAYETTHLRQRLRWFTILTLAAIVILLWLADQLGKRLAGYLSRPLESLAAQVRGIDPDARGRHVTEDYGDQALDGIAQAFNQYLNQMDAYVRREQAFTRVASHELRTPLAVVASAVALMRLQLSAQDDEPAPLARIERALNQMRETTDALLMLARNRRQDERESRCRVDKMLADVAASHRLLVGKKAVDIVVDSTESCTVVASERLVAVLIANLVRNAVEHTDRGRIVLSTDRHGLSVVDTGSGMDPKRLDHFLSPDPSDYEGASFGLGLYIVGQICSRYGWRASFSSNDRGGTTARVDFAPSAL